MDLSGLLPLIREMPSYCRLLEGLRGDPPATRVVALDSARPCLLACLQRDLALPMLVVTARQERARQLCDEIPLWLGAGAEVRLFPEPDALPYERISSDPYTVQQRLKVLASLSRGVQSGLVVASAYAVVHKTVAATAFAQSCQTVKTGARVNLERMLAGWVELGYAMDTSVQLPGTMSRRGGIVDVYPPDSDLPARIELFGDKVESIRLFDPSTQRSVKPVPEITVIPAREMAAPFGTIADNLQHLDLSSLSENARGKVREDIARLFSGQSPDGVGFYAPVANHGAFLDYFPAGAIVVPDQRDAIEAATVELDAQAAELSQAQREHGELPADFPRPYLSWPELLHGLDRFAHRLELEQWAAESSACAVGFNPPPVYGGRLTPFLEEAKAMVKAKGRVVVVTQEASRLAELLEEGDIAVSPVSDVAAMPPSGSITVVRGSLGGGWRIDGTGGDTVISDVELFGFAKKRRTVPKRFARREDLLSDLSTGDYVVHIDHGIGRFGGVTKLGLDNGQREYLILEYAAGDRLYVPSDQLDRVTRYIGPGGYSPSLSRLGTQEWNRAKQRVREAANELAKSLLALYSAREVAAGFAFSPDTVWQQELEASFPYVETQDQLEAVQKVKRDMEKARPMDRLVCGDVGYGKTEVAIRAAFKAVMDGMQVAVLVPTTVLADQHLTTFKERLGAFPVTVDSLSRFRSAREQQEVLQGLVNGSVDICIGTHRLLQKDVAFKNLGLVVVDEEQRFGVGHKERLKQLRREVDVLTMSATPIPRTLHMSLIGVRDMSTMETPPEERLPIKTYVGGYSERLVREAILRELERDGQVFYVHNRVQTIGAVARRLGDLVPEAKIGIGHGQMPEEALESAMLDFAEGRIDVLVCTTIIESGLDLPNANTLIVDRADRMGLTQLYQLRGRVGRGANRAYAYFLYDKGKELTDASEKRLRTIFEATELGAGFRIAMKDLEIRGAGTLLGPEQSGHMGAVGFELYCQLLSDAVTDLKAIGEPRAAHLPPSTSVDLPLPAFIPEEYVADLNARLALYLRLAKVDSLAKLKQIEGDLEDRFGPLPQQGKDLLYVVRLKLLGTAAGIQAISWEDGHAVLKLGQGTRLGALRPQRGLSDALKVGATQLRLDTKRAGGDWKRLLEGLVERLSQSPPRMAAHLSRGD